MYRFYSCYYWIRPLLSDYHLSMNGLSCQESVGKWREGYLERWSAVCLGKVPSDVTGHLVSNCNFVDHLNSEDKSPGCLCSCVSIKSVFEDHHDNSKVIWLSMWVFVPIACVCMCMCVCGAQWGKPVAKSSHLWTSSWRQKGWRLPKMTYNSPHSHYLSTQTTLRTRHTITTLVHQGWMWSVRLSSLEAEIINWCLLLTFQREVQYRGKQQ